MRDIKGGPINILMKTTRMIPTANIINTNITTMQIMPHSPFSTSLGEEQIIPLWRITKDPFQRLQEWQPINMGTTKKATAISAKIPFPNRLISQQISSMSLSPCSIFCKELEV